MENKGNNHHMMYFIERKIQKMQKTAKGLQYKIEKESNQLSENQLNGLRSLKKSTDNAITKNKNELKKLELQKNKIN
jgi:hypothetical protein